jgi:GTP-dependent phosphoenolpyruvate carboxykinase
MDELQRKKLREIADQMMEQLWREGTFVKALDASGQPLQRNGKQVYKLAEYASETELQRWIWEHNDSRN